MTGKILTKISFQTDLKEDTELELLMQIVAQPKLRSSNSALVRKATAIQWVLWAKCGSKFI